MQVEKSQTDAGGTVGERGVLRLDIGSCPAGGGTSRTGAAEVEVIQKKAPAAKSLTRLPRRYLQLLRLLPQRPRIARARRIPHMARPQVRELRPVRRVDPFRPSTRAKCSPMTSRTLQAPAAG